MVKLSQDSCFTEEHPLLSVWCPPAQSLHCYQHFPATQRMVTTTRNLAKLGCNGINTEEITLCCCQHVTTARFKRKETMKRTCTNHLLDLEVSWVDLTGKFFDGLARVLISGWVNVILNSTWEQEIYFWKTDSELLVLYFRHVIPKNSYKITMNPKINNSFYYISLTSVTDVPLESVTVWTLPPLTAM